MTAATVQIATRNHVRCTNRVTTHVRIPHAATTFTLCPDGKAAP